MYTFSYAAKLVLHLFLHRCGLSVSLFVYSFLHLFVCLLASWLVTLLACQIISLLVAYYVSWLVG